MQQDHQYCVILAGGSGERLWPLSTRNKPKQFLSVAGATLLEQTIARAEQLVSSKHHIWVSTTAAYASVVSDLAADRIGMILVEPEARNTAPSILYACHRLLAHDPDACVIFLSSDAFIPVSDTNQFCADVQIAFEHTAHDQNALVVLGVTPSYAATAYGYIEYHADDAVGCYKVDRFHEKPTPQVAAYYLTHETMLWNIGIVVVRAETCIALADRYAAQLSMKMRQVLHGQVAYAQLPSISFDYAILELCDTVFVVPTNIRWSDVGNLNVLLSLAQQHGQSTAMAVITDDAHDNVVHAPHKLVALIGVEELCIVDTPQVLLITRRSQAESVKAVVAQLKQAGLSDYL